MSVHTGWYIYRIGGSGTTTSQVGVGTQTLNVSGPDNIIGNASPVETISLTSPSLTWNYGGTASSGANSGFYGTIGAVTNRWYFTTTPLTIGSPVTVVPDTLGAGGADFAICFMPGTLIATPEGQATVESLRPGDLVVTADGQAKPVVWVGRQTICRLFRRGPEVLPIRIRAGALGENLPARDLLVSPCHALALDGILVQAGALVNGVSITRETAVAEVFTYFHIELAAHDLVLAEGVPAESFVDHVDRRIFDNWAEHPAAETEELGSIEEMDLPRAKSARQVPMALRARLEARAEALGVPAAA